MSKPVTVLVTYIPKKGKEAELGALVRKHAAALRGTGLITDDPVRAWRCVDKRDHGDAGEYFVETFAWKDETASDAAHQTPEVMAVWEPMGPVLEQLKIAFAEPMHGTSA